MSSLIENIEQDKQFFEKIKETTERYKQKMLHYQKLLNEDGPIDEKQQILIDEVFKTISMINQTLIKKESKIKELEDKINTQENINLRSNQEQTIIYKDLIVATDEMAKQFQPISNENGLGDFHLKFIVDFKITSLIIFDSAGSPIHNQDLKNISPIELDIEFSKLTSNSGVYYIAIRGNKKEQIASKKITYIKNIKKIMLYIKINSCSEEITFPVEISTKSPSSNNPDNIVDDVSSERPPKHIIELAELRHFTKLQSSLEVSLGATGNVIAKHFRDGNGKALTWKETSVPSIKINASAKMNAAQENIATQLLVLFRNGELNKQSAQNIVNQVLPIDLTNESIFLTALVGGTQKGSVNILNVTEEIIEIQLVITDRFGFDKDDTNPFKSLLPGLVQGYMLQHEDIYTETRYKPFLQHFTLPMFRLETQE
jgi:hypothetical protein